MNFKKQAVGFYQQPVLYLYMSNTFAKFVNLFFMKGPIANWCQHGLVLIKKIII